MWRAFVLVFGYLFTMVVVLVMLRSCLPRITWSPYQKMATTYSSVGTIKPWTKPSYGINTSKSTEVTLISPTRNTSFYDHLQSDTLQTVQAYDDHVDSVLATMISEHVFHRKQRLVTDYEFEYLNNLRRWLGNDFDILSQVSLSALLSCDFIFMNLKDQDESKVAQRVQWMIVDFVVVNKSTDKVVCVIELDDATHGREDRQRRDRRLEQFA